MPDASDIVQLSQPRESVPVRSVASTPQSSRKETKPASVPSKRARDFEERSSELPPVSASQPLPTPSKRARHMHPPPPATQPPPSTPASKPAAAHSSMPAPTSAAKGKWKGKGKGQQKLASRKRNETFWHLDGSVVVQVQNTLFRLHRSRLSQHSTYFAALFRKSDGRGRCVIVIDEDESAPGADTRVGSSNSSNADDGGEGPSDTVDSCPVYVVTGVSVLDFERLLTALDAGM
ncbi:hypothetical protein C8Q78DRAFT_1024417 [Trametes maxima]|nr:hypothetical protein C8Q78DRAFT_1024417 [Trametes maxima]